MTLLVLTGLYCSKAANWPQAAPAAAPAAAASAAVKVAATAAAAVTAATAAAAVAAAATGAAAEYPVKLGHHVEHGQGSLIADSTDLDLRLGALLQANSARGYSTKNEEQRSSTTVTSVLCSVETTLAKDPLSAPSTLATNLQWRTLALLLLGLHLHAGYVASVATWLVLCPATYTSSGKYALQVTLFSPSHHHSIHTGVSCPT